MTSPSFTTSLFQFEVNETTYYISAPTLEAAFSLFKQVSEQDDFDAVYSLGSVSVASQFPEEF